MRRITMSDLENMIAAYSDGKKVERGCFYAYDPFTGHVTAVDNRTGEMWTEVFATIEQAKEWLSE